MIFGQLGTLNAFSTYDIFHLRWVYCDVTPLEVEQHLYSINHFRVHTHNETPHRAGARCKASSFLVKITRLKGIPYLQLPCWMLVLQGAVFSRHLRNPNAREISTASFPLCSPGGKICQKVRKY